MIESGRGRRIAILIGTNEYSKLDKLEFAENDVREMKEVLLNSDICGFDEVIELIDKNKEEVSQTIEKLFKNAKKDDQVLIYFSGHGKPSYKFDLCLLFIDTDPDSLLATSLKFDYINECKEQSSCKRVVVILDCCYSGTAGMRGDYLEETLSTYSGSGTILLTSTGETGSNIAKEDKELKHGVFTSYLLKGLKDWAADYDNDGIITVDDLYRYTFNETTNKGLQRPQIKGSYEGKVILGRNLQKVKDREFEEKKDKLMKYLSSAPSSVLYRSLTLLQKMYKNSSALEPIEVSIKPHLESLLDGKIQAETYVEIVKYQDTYQEKIDGKQHIKEQKEVQVLQKVEKEQKNEPQKEREEQKQREEQKHKEESRKKREEKEMEKGRGILEIKQGREQVEKGIEEEEKTRNEEEEKGKLVKHKEAFEKKKVERDSKAQDSFLSANKQKSSSNKGMLLIGVILGILLISAAVILNQNSGNNITPIPIPATPTSIPATPMPIPATPTPTPTTPMPILTTPTPTPTTPTPTPTTPTPTPTTPIPVPTVNAPVVEDFSVDVSSGPFPLSVQFTSITTGSPTKYLWVFEPQDDDYYSYHNKTARHTFHEPGIYTISLTVENSAGNHTLTKKDYIKVTD